jgi:hypothetical protein
MNKIVAFLLIILVSFSYERMRCFDDLDGSPTEKCMVTDVFNGLQYFDSCKKGKVCVPAEIIENSPTPSELPIYLKEGETANYGVCAPLPYGGFEGAVCGDNAECFSYNCDGTSCGEPKEFCKMHSECKKGQYCDNEDYTDGTKNFDPTYQCKDLSSSTCYDNYMCPPLYLCHYSYPTNSYVGTCKKIGSISGDTQVATETSSLKLNLLCQSGYSVKGYCVKESTINCVTGEGKLITNKKENDYEDDYCRKSLLDNSNIPKVTTDSIKAFQEYAKEVDDIEVKPDKKHANYGYIRYHYDKSKLKELLTKAIYHELNNEDDETAECLFDYVKQVTLSGEKINFSKILVLTFALLLI